MTLSDRQIERYSRQILVAGGVAQERLLAARVALMGSAATVEPALRYLVGAGVGRLHLELLDDDRARRDRLVARARELDSNVVVESEEPPAASPDLRVVLVDTDRLVEVRSRRAELSTSAVVLARLAPPLKLAALPQAGPLPAVFDTELCASASYEQSDPSLAGFVTMVAVTEALKLLIGPAELAKPVMIDFDGYQTRTRELEPAPQG